MKKLAIKPLNIFTIIFVLFIFMFIIIGNILFQPIKIQGQSMEPTLHEKSLHYTVRYSPINRFDIVVAKLNDNQFIVKRVIGLPNDTIEYKENQLYINNTKIDEPYIINRYTQSNFKLKLKDDEYFLLGDNRAVSKDSRFTGPFKINQIISRLLY